MTDMRETVEKILIRIQGGCGIDDARDILAALSAAGLAIVPKVLTPAMTKAGGDELFECYHGYNEETRRRMRALENPTLAARAERVWSAMLAVAIGPIEETAKDA